MPVFDLKFINVPRKSISLDKIHGFIKDGDTKRIHFDTSHQNALRRTDGRPYIGKIILPFDDTINAFIKAHLGSDITLFKSQYNDGYYRQIFNKSEFEEFEKFIKKYRDIVFFRDLLDLSITLSINFHEDGKHTEIGILEYEAKYQRDIDAENKLVDTCKKWLDILPYYKKVDYICAMPCSDRSKKSLPWRIVNALGNFENISDEIYWQSKTKSLKDAETIEEKLPILEESNLTIDRNLEGKAVFLFDDLYMSGLSMQYVAMKLKEAGAKWVFGLCLVKSRNNTTR